MRKLLTTRLQRCWGQIRWLRWLVWLLLTGLLLLPNLSYGQVNPYLLTHVALVVQFGDSSIETDCVDVNGQAVTGKDVVVASRFNEDIVQDQGQGEAVCQLDSEGCNTDSSEGETDFCFCKYDFDLRGDRWQYFQLVNGQWQRPPPERERFFNNVVEPGNTEGWAWDTDTATIDRIFTFGEICTAPTVTPTPTASATPTASDTPTTAPTTTPSAEPTASNETTTTGPTEAPVRPTVDLAQEAPPPSRPQEGRDPTATRTIVPTPTPRRTATSRPTNTNTPGPTSPPAPTSTSGTSGSVSSSAPTNTSAPTNPPATEPPPTNTTVPTNTSAPTQPPAPTLEPLPTSTPDATATMAVILQTEVAAASSTPRSSPTPAVAAVFVSSPTPDQTTVALLQQADANTPVAEPTQPSVTPTNLPTAPAVAAAPPSPVDTDAEAFVVPDSGLMNSATGAASGMGLYLILGAGVALAIGAIVIRLLFLVREYEQEEDV